MVQFPAWVAKVQVAFVALGTFLTILAFQGVAIPEWVPNFLSEQTWEKIIQAITAVFTFYQYIKGIFTVLPPSPNVGVRVLSEGAAQRYAWNPFAINPAKA